MSYRFVQIGTGGRGATWCRSILPPFVESGVLDPVAAVDIDEDALQHARDGLGVPNDRCYTDAADAFAATDADFCTIVVPPWVHEEIVDAALAHDLDILSEKPIADSLSTAVRIAERVDRAGANMGVTLTHRFDRDKTTLRRKLRRDRNGPLDYLVGRFTCSARSYGSWGAFRHDMDDPLIVEGAVHQLDFLADMAGAPCETLYADTWLPEWGEYAGDAQALVQLRFENGVRATWEGAKCNATTMNGWGNDYVRAECRDATLILDARELRRYPYDPNAESVDGALDPGSGAAIPLDDRDGWAGAWLVEQFVDWLDGGEPMATNVEDSLQSMALHEAAIASSRAGEPVQVQDMLAKARATARD